MSRKHHYLKTMPQFFDDVRSEKKTFEVRFNDRDFHEGDILHLQEYNGTELTGWEIRANVTYVLDDPRFCKEGFVVMGIEVYATSD